MAVARAQPDFITVGYRLHDIVVRIAADGLLFPLAPVLFIADQIVPDTGHMHPSNLHGIGQRPAQRERTSAGLHHHIFPAHTRHLPPGDNLSLGALALHWVHIDDLDRVDISSL